MVEAISIIVNCYNLVLPVSTFPKTLINLNDNLKNLYIYEIVNYEIKNANYTIHKMKPSRKYIKMMKHKWNKTREQLDLMINEKCINNNIIIFFLNYNLYYIFILIYMFFVMIG